METGKTPPLYYTRVIWLKDSEQQSNPVDLLLRLLQEHVYTYKGIPIVLCTEEIVSLETTRTVYEYFQKLKDRDTPDCKTLTILNYSNLSTVPRDVLVARTTKLWTSFDVAYINCLNPESVRFKYRRAFNYVLGAKNTIDVLTTLVKTGKCNEADTF